MKILVWWNGLEKTQRVYLAVGVAIIAVLTAAFAWFALRTTYVPLFDADAAPADADAIVAKLDAVGADYRVDADSKRILVPEERRERLKSVLTGDGGTFRQPKGFEVFDNADFGMTEFSQRINYERGLEGELTRTIMGLDNVRYARLHLVMPDGSLFQQDREQPKASVTLMTTPGKSLTAAQIQGIRELVAYAVPGLKADMVSVHDYRGVDLAPMPVTKDAISAAVDSRIRAKEQIEDYLAAKVYDVLAPLYPPGSIAIGVDVSLRMDHVSSVRDQTTPALVESGSRSRAAAAASREKEKPAAVSDGSAPPATPPPPAPAPAISDLGIDKLHQQIDELPGGIERLSVGVVIPAVSPQQLSLDEIRQLIAGTVGASPQRGDTVAVQIGSVKAASAPAAADSQPAPAASPAPGPASGAVQVQSPERWVAIVAVAGSLLLIVGWGLGRRARPAVHQLTAEEREVLLSKVKQWLNQDA